MTFTLTITLGNAAMQTKHDVATALRAVAVKLAGNDYGPVEEDYGNRIGDENGNKVGEWGFQE